MLKKPFFLISLGIIILSLSVGFWWYQKKTPSPISKNDLSQVGENQDLEEKIREEEKTKLATKNEPPFENIFIADFSNNRVIGVNRETKKIFWEYSGTNPRLPWEQQFWVAEYVSIAPDGNLIVTDAQGQRVVKIDRQTKKITWSYGKREQPGHAPGLLHAPDKAFQIKDGGILINDGNNRRVIIVDPQTNEIVWQFGKTGAMGTGEGLLMGNTHARELADGAILITDTTNKKIIKVARDTKEILWEWKNPESKWIQHTAETPEGNFTLEDRQKKEVYEVSKNGEIIWKLDNSGPLKLGYPTNIVKLKNNHYLINDPGKSHIFELNPENNEIVWEVKGLGFTSDMDIE